jgi:mono/diheme cytochrome c family protein
MKRIALTLLVLPAVAGLVTPAVGAEMNGKEVFDRYCTYCHGSGEGPGTMQLSRTRGKDKGLLTQRTDLAPEYIQYVVRHGLRSMPPFVPSDLTEAKLRALVTFLTEQRAVGK